MTNEIDSADKLEDLRKEVAGGLLYTHARLSEGTKTSLETASFLYGLIELLREKGLLSIEELDERMREVAGRLKKKNSEKGVGVLLQESECEKYGFKDVAEVACKERIHLCRATCCRLPFALSKQDIREGVLHWDLGEPYMIAQEKNGYCTHLEKDRWSCSVREHRPVPCRAYDCRQDGKIWLDFDGGIVNPDILKEDWPRCLSTESE